MIEKLRTDEHELVGQWYMENGKMKADSVCKRIQRLVAEELTEITFDESGWDTLYRDLSDGRYWEYYYPYSHMHGGGPPALREIQETDAKKKYHF